MKIFRESYGLHIEDATDNEINQLEKIAEKFKKRRYGHCLKYGKGAFLSPYWYIKNMMDSSTGEDFIREMEKSGIQFSVSD